MAKDLKAGMGRGLGSLVQPTAPKQTEEPKTEPQQAVDAEAEQLASAQQAADAMLEAAAKKQQGTGRTRKQTTSEQKKASSVTMGLRDGFTRSTIICNIDTLAKMKEIAYLERSPLMDVVDEALATYIAKYESKHGEVVPPEPKKRRR